MSGIYRAECRAVAPVKKTALFEPQVSFVVFRMELLGVKVADSLSAPKPPDALFRFVFGKTKRKECCQ